MKYILIQGLYSIDGETHIGFGIACAEERTLSLEDLATNPIFVTKLVKLCNDLALSPIHLMDVAEDFLVEAT